MKLLLSLVAALTLSAVAPAQNTGVWVLPWLHQLAPVTVSQDTTEGVLSIHTDGMVTLVSNDGRALSWSRLPSSSARLVGDEPVPSLETSWTDRQGVTHTVTTPIVSTTPAGLTRAQTTHNNLVKLMQRQFPPAPVP